MTNDEILQAAKEAGLTGLSLIDVGYLERFVADIEKRTIERCAVALMDQRDELLAALNFARQGYQAASENGEPDEVEWAEMYLRSIDVAIASVKGEQ